MQPHPENSDQVNELIKGLGNLEVVPVFCNSCNDFTIMNAAYAKILDGEISSCSRCRQ
jgi:hypothetical protein